MLSVALWLACGGPPDETETTVAVLTPSDVAVVVRGAVTPGPRISGTLVARNEAVLRTEVGGSVSAVHVEVGDAVERGQLLVSIDNDGVFGQAESASAAVLASERDLANATRDGERARRLFASGGASQRDVDVADAALAAASARVGAARASAAAAREGIGGTRVVAPIAGVVATRSVGVGDVVGPGLPLLTLVDPSALRVEGSVPAADAGAVSVGDDVVFLVQGRSEPVVGTVSRKAPSVDSVTRQIAVLVDIPNAEGALLAGLYARGRVAGRLREGNLVPIGAVTETSRGASVLALRDGVVAQVEVVLGARDVLGERVEIVSGLAQGDQVLVGAGRSVPPGAPVELRTGS